MYLLNGYFFVIWGSIVEVAGCLFSCFSSRIVFKNSVGTSIWDFWAMESMNCFDLLFCCCSALLAVSKKEIREIKFQNKKKSETMKLQFSLPSSCSSLAFLTYRDTFSSDGWKKNEQNFFREIKLQPEVNSKPFGPTPGSSVSCLHQIPEEFSFAYPAPRMRLLLSP